MGLRSVEEYKESLRDGRHVYILGERVEDITKHPILGVAVDTVAEGFALTSSDDPDTHKLFTARHPETGELINRFFVTPKDSEDLFNRTRMIQRSIELTHGPSFWQRYRDRLFKRRLCGRGKNGEKGISGKRSPIFRARSQI